MIFSVGRAVRAANTTLSVLRCGPARLLHFAVPASFAVQPTLPCVGARHGVARPVRAFATVLLTRVFAQHRRLKDVTLSRLPDLGRRRPTGLPIDPLRPRRCASCCASGPAQTSMFGRSPACGSPVSQLVRESRSTDSTFPGDEACQRQANSCRGSGEQAAGAPASPRPFFIFPACCVLIMVKV
jgi:hypothetical protein